MLAGLAVALRTRRGREAGALGPERLALLKRAGVLLGVGVLHLHMWDWDILHLYGFYLALALVIGSRRACWPCSRSSS